MPGTVARGNIGAGSQPGKVFNPSTGLWVDDPSQVNPVNQVAAATGNMAQSNAQIAAGTAAGTYHAPMTQAEQSQSQLALQQLAQQQSQFAATQQSGAATLEEQQREARAGETLASDKFNQTKTDRSSALTALQALRTPGAAGAGGGVGAVDGTGGSGSLQDDATTAALTASKERSGLRLSSALKALREMTAGRGQSGLEGRNERDLFAADLGDQNSTERDLLINRANWNAGRGAQIEDRNFAAAQLAQQQYLQGLLGVYGMSY